MGSRFHGIKAESETGPWEQEVGIKLPSIAMGRVAGPLGKAYLFPPRRLYAAGHNALLLYKEIATQHCAIFIIRLYCEAEIKDIWQDP